MAAQGFVNNKSDGLKLLDASVEKCIGTYGGGSADHPPTSVVLYRLEDAEGNRSYQTMNH